MSDRQHSDYAEFLLQIADSTAAPDHSDEFCGPKEFAACDGWTVYLHYRVNGDLSYIDRFVTPTGADLDPWNDLPEGADRDALIAWSRARPPRRNVGHLTQDRYLALKAETAVLPPGPRKDLQEYLDCELLRHVTPSECEKAAPGAGS